MTNPKERSGPSQPATAPARPTPEDPREHEPMKDPPIYPEHDDGEGEIGQPRGIEAEDPAPDVVVS